MLQALAPFLEGLAGLITACTPVLALLRRKDGKPLLPLPGDPLGWARAAEWAAGLGLVMGMAVAIAGLSDSHPVMESTGFERLRFFVALIGLLAVSTSAWCVVTGWHDASDGGPGVAKGYQSARIGAGTLTAGAMVLVGMLVI